MLSSCRALGDNGLDALTLKLLDLKFLRYLSGPLCNDWHTEK